MRQSGTECGHLQDRYDEAGAWDAGLCPVRRCGSYTFIGVNDHWEAQDPAARSVRTMGTW